MKYETGDLFTSWNENAEISVSLEGALLAAMNDYWQKWVKEFMDSLELMFYLDSDDGPSILLFTKFNFTDPETGYQQEQIAEFSLDDVNKWFYKAKSHQQQNEISEWVSQDRRIADIAERKFGYVEQSK